MIIKISDHQAKMIRAAVQAGNTEFTVWSLPGTQPRSYRALYRFGLTTSPDWSNGQAPRLTDSGKDVAWILNKVPRQRDFDVADDTVPAEHRPVPRPLGENQYHVLRALAEHCGVWYPGAGWIWDTTSGTVRILDSLVKRGMATKTTEYTRTEPRLPYPKYTITDEGRAWAQRSRR